MDLKDRILQLSYENKLSHLTSTLTSVDIIDEIYKIKRPQDKFILSNGHANLALQVVMKNYGVINEEAMFTHPDRDQKGVYCSTGSLGQGLPIAVGVALSNRSNKVFCMISDGECSEGSIWEALRIAHENKLKNLVILVNVNGWAAYKKVEGIDLFERFRAFGYEVHIKGESHTNCLRELLGKRFIYPTIIFVRTDVSNYPFLKGQIGHYKVMTKEEYESTKNIC